jgi:tRNA threonylcarbamoyladenosine biosynthesis protein TsaB
MKILGIDTATSYCGVALFNDRKFLGEFSINIGNFHDQKLVSMISGLLNSCNESLDKIDVISVSIGPGSFTGLRIGLSVAKGLAISKDKKITGVSSLDAMAYRYYNTHPVDVNRMICAALDAKRDEVYYALYRFNSNTMIQERVSDFKCELVNNLEKSLAPDSVILGDSVRKIREQFKSDGFIYDFSEMSRADAKSIALAGYENAKIEKFDDLNTLEPVYVKDFIPILK